MKSGDLVRFKGWYISSAKENSEQEWRIGLLLEYHTWEKVGTVLWNGNTYRIRAENIQKAGKKYVKSKNR